MRDAEEDAGQRVQRDAQFQEAAARHRARRLIGVGLRLQHHESLLLHRSLLKPLSPTGISRGLPSTSPPDRAGPGYAGRCDASQATTSETSWLDIDRPAT